MALREVVIKIHSSNLVPGHARVFPQHIKEVMISVDYFEQGQFSFLVISAPGLFKPAPGL